MLVVPSDGFRTVEIKVWMRKNESMKLFDEHYVREERDEMTNYPQRKKKSCS